MVFIVLGKLVALLAVSGFAKESLRPWVEGLKMWQNNTNLWFSHCREEVSDDDSDDQRAKWHGIVGLVVPTDGQVVLPHHLRPSIPPMSPSPLPHPPLHVRTVGDMVALCSALKQKVLYTTLHTSRWKRHWTCNNSHQIHWWAIDSVCVFSLFTVCVVDCMYLYIIYHIFFFLYNYLSLCLQLFQSGRCSFSLYFDLFVYFSFARYQFLHQILTFPRGASHNVTKVQWEHAAKHFCRFFLE